MLEIGCIPDFPECVLAVEGIGLDIGVLITICLLKLIEDLVGETISW
jgi:hypothetical protein